MPKQSRPADAPLSHPDKILDPSSKLSKQALAEYYAAVAQRMLPHIAGRALSVVRCPEGTTRPCFFQKNVSPGMPASHDGNELVSASDASDLATLAQMGALEIHPWGSRLAAPDAPDRIIFDLDPDPSIAWAAVAAAAVELRRRLASADLKSFLKATGGKGLHVVVPIRPRHSWSVVKSFARDLAEEMQSSQPQLYVTSARKAARRGRIYIDYLRNTEGATAVAPYSPRARAGVPVAFPMRWSELKKNAQPTPLQVASFAKWRDRLRSDPWAGIDTVRQDIPKKRTSAK